MTYGGKTEEKWARPNEDEDLGPVSFYGNYWAPRQIFASQPRPRMAPMQAR